MRETFESRLRRTLDRDFQSGRIVLSRVVTVSREHYANILAVDAKYASSKFSHVFRCYDERVSARFLARARSLIDAAIADGTLPLLDGKVERRWLHSALGVSSAWLYRNSSLAAMLSETDAKVRDSGYRPKERLDLLSRLEEMLANACPLAKSRRQIALAELARRLGVPLHLFREEPFNTAVRAKQKKLAAGEGLQLGDVMVNGQVKAFSRLLPVWPERLVVRISTEFKTFSESYSKHTKAHYPAFMHFTAWVAGGNTEHAKRSFDLMRAGKSVPSDVWTEMLYEYQAATLEQVQNHRYVENMFGSLNAVLRHFGAVSLFPTPEVALTVPRRPWSRPRHRRSVAEVSSLSRADAVVEQASQTLQDASTKFTVDYDERDSRAFLACLREDFEQQAKTVPEDVPQAVLTVIDRRLTCIKLSASELFSKGQRLLSEGLALQGVANLPEGFPETLSKMRGRDARRQLVRQYFPRPSDEAATALAKANMLVLVKRYFAGICPSVDAKGVTVKKLGGSFFAQRYFELGGRIALQNLLTPSPDSCAAAITLYLAEAGANIAVAVELKANCLSTDDESRGFTTVTGHKLRARGKPIFAELPTRGGCITALQWLIEAMRPLRSAASSSDGEGLLFCAVRAERVEPLDATWYLRWFKNFIKDVPGLSSLPLVPSMLRPSVLLKAALENDGRLMVGAAVAQHGLTVSKGYQDKAPVRHIWDERMRQFQHHLETVGLLGASQIAMPIGQSAEGLESRTAGLQETGLGTFCKNRFGRPGFEGQACRQLNCPGTGEQACPQMEIVVTPRTAAQMQIWKGALERAAPDWERDREERWAGLWLPWLCLLTVVEEKATRGQLLKLWDEGTALRTSIEQRPEYTAPCPW